MESKHRILYCTYIYDCDIACHRYQHTLTCCHFDVSKYIPLLSLLLLLQPLSKYIVLCRTRINIALITLIVYLIQLVVSRQPLRYDVSKARNKITDIICDVCKVELRARTHECEHHHQHSTQAPAAQAALFTLIHRPFLERY